LVSGQTIFLGLENPRPNKCLLRI
ncbi:hypothetical protein VCHENC02_0494B, partial [Vibrio harveyi]